MNIKFGVAGKFFKKSLLVAVDIDKSDKRELKYHSGIELKVKEMLAIRIGYDIGSITAGFGVGLNNLFIDYAVLSHVDLGISYRVSMGVRFGKSKEDVVIERVNKQKETEQKEEEIKSLLERANESFEKMNWRDAAKNYEKAAAIDGSNLEAKSRLAVSKQNLVKIDSSMKKGREFFEARQWDEALAEFEKVILVEPQNKEALEYKERAEKEKLVRAKGLNIAVADFGAKSVSAADASIVSDMVRSDIVKCGKFNVVDRNNMELILSEQKLQMSGCTTQECAVKLGKLLNVQKVIVGTLSKLMDSYYIVVDVIDVEQGKIEFSDKAKAFTSDEIVGASEKITKNIIENYK